MKYIIIIIVITLIYFSLIKKEATIYPINTQETILAFGDSLTYGKGSHEQSYPKQLQNLIKIKTINAGVIGETSSDGLKRLPSLLKKYHPALVVLCHGGNDFLKKKSHSTLKSNLLKMSQLIKSSGANVLLVGVPNFKMYHFVRVDLYEEVANEVDVMFEGDVLTEIENNTDLKSDRIHPNAKGYALMAQTFADILVKHKLIN